MTGSKAFENSEKTEFDVYGFLCRFATSEDKEWFEKLKNRGVDLSEKTKEWLTNKFFRNDHADIWENVLRGLSAEDLAPALQAVSNELGGKKICRPDRDLLSLCEDKLTNAENISTYFRVFDKAKEEKKRFLKNAVDQNRVEILAIAAEDGWFKSPQRRDELIEYALQNGKTECAAWLLDYKNRAVDLAAERARAEKRQDDLLNSAPYSIKAMRDIWNWKKLEDGSIMLTDYKGSSAEVTVPERIGKRKVTALNSTFNADTLYTTEELSELRKAVTRITLPKTINKITGGAFSDCVMLESVNLPLSISAVDVAAFCGCRSLKEVKIPPRVSWIRASMFCGCASLRSINIPCGVKDIDIYAFSCCTLLEEVTLPDSVTEIERCAFRQCKNLKFIELPSALKEISDNCFFGSGLETIVIPRGVKVISEFAFSECRGLKSAGIPETVKKIGAEAFSRCSSLTGVVIPEGVTRIDKRAFADCPKLIRVELPRSLEIMASNIFENSPNVTAVVLQNSAAEDLCKTYKIPFAYKERRNVIQRIADLLNGRYQ